MFERCSILFIILLLIGKSESSKYITILNLKSWIGSNYDFFKLKDLEKSL